VKKKVLLFTELRVKRKVLLFTELNGRAASARRHRVCAAAELGAILAATRPKPAALPGPAQGKFLLFLFLGFYLCESVCVRPCPTSVE